MDEQRTVFVGLDAIRTASQGLNRPAPGRIVLISDGETTSGRPNSEAIKAARKANVPVSTIAFGTPNGTIDVGGRRLRVPVDKEALQKIADDTGGRSFEALTGSQLKAVYSDIEEQIAEFAKTTGVKFSVVWDKAGEIRGKK